jgi:hypothetical protein
LNKINYKVLVLTHKIVEKKDKAIKYQINPKKRLNKRINANARLQHFSKKVKKEKKTQCKIKSMKLKLSMKK